MYFSDTPLVINPGNPVQDSQDFARMLVLFQHGQDVACRIFEPCYSRTWTSEDSTFVSLQIGLVLFRHCVLVVMAVVVIVVVIFAGGAVDQRLWGAGDADECEDRAHSTFRCRAHLEHNVVDAHRDVCLSFVVELALKHNTLIANCEDVFNLQPSIARQPRCNEGAAVQTCAHVASL